MIRVIIQQANFNGSLKDKLLISIDLQYKPLQKPIYVGETEENKVICLMRGLSNKHAMFKLQ